MNYGINKSDKKSYKCISGLLLVCALIMHGLSFAKANSSDPLWTQTSGPAGGKFISVEINPNDPNEILISGGGGLFRSTDEGASWEKIKFVANTIPKDPDLEGLKKFPIISDIKFSPGDKKTIYLATESGILKSVDGGNIWDWPYYNSEFSNLGKLIISKSGLSVLYTWTDNGKIFKTNDSGSSWADITHDLNLVNITAIAEVGTGKLYIGSGGEEGNLYRTENDGVSWEKVDMGQPKESFADSILVNPGDPDEIFVSFSSAFTRERIPDTFRTTDGGKTWKDIEKQGILLSYSGKDYETIYMFNPVNELSKTSDGGDTWNVLKVSSCAKVTCGDFGDIAIDPNDENTIYLPLSGGGMSKSADGGNTWQLINKGLITSGPGNLAVDMNDPEHVYADTYQTTDGGKNWESMNDRGIYHPFIDDVYIDPTNPKTAYLIGDIGILYKTTDNGLSWKVLFDPMNPKSARQYSTPFRFSSIYALAVSPEDSDIVYAVNNGFGIFKSKDGGNSWNYNVFSPDYTYSIAIDPADSALVYSGYKKKVFETASGVYRSKTGTKEIKMDSAMQDLINKSLSSTNSQQAADEGWSEVFNVPNAESISWVEIDPKNPNRIYSSATGLRGTIYVTDDKGATWKSLNDSLTFSNIHAIAIDPNDEKTVYAAPWGGGLFRSKNAGFTWEEVKTPTISIPSIIIDPDDSNHLTIADRLKPRIYESLDMGMTWKEPVSLDEEKYYRIMAMEYHDSSLYFSVLDRVSGLISLFLNGPMSGSIFKLDGGKPVEITNGVKRQVLKFLSDGQRLLTINHINGAYELGGDENWKDISSGLPDIGFQDIMKDGDDIYIAGASDIGLDGKKRGSDDNIINEIYKSSDNGATWEGILKNNPFSSPVKKLIQHPDNQNVFFAATGTGLYVSSDKGKTWEAQNTGLNFKNIGSMAVGNGYLYAGTLGGGVYTGKINQDYSVSWQMSGGPYPKIYNIQLKADPKNDGVLYATSFPGGVFKTTDSGTTWSEINFAMPSFKVEDPFTQGYYSIDIDPENTQTLYLGIYSKGVFKSTNGGSVWLPMYGSHGQNKDIMTKGITNIKVDPSDPDRIYLATNEGFYYSEDGAENWNELSDGLPTKDIFVLAIGSNGKLYGGTKGYGVYWLDFSQNKWIQTNPLGQFGLYWSSWERPLYQYSDMLIDPNDSNIIYLSSFPTGLFKSTDGGNTWRESNTGLIDEGTDGIFSLTFDPKDTNIIYAGTYNGVSVTYDGAKRWKRISNGMPPQMWPFTVAVDPNDSKIIYASTKTGVDKGFCRLPEMSCGTVLKTTDGGESWSEINKDLKPRDEFFNIIIYPYNSNYLFLNTTRSGVYMSDDAGESWKQINDGLTDLYSAAANNIAKNMIMDSAGKYLYLSTKNSGVWKADLSKLNIPKVTGHSGPKTAAKIQKEVKNEITWPLIVAGFSSGAILILIIVMIYRKNRQNREQSFR